MYPSPVNAQHDCMCHCCCFIEVKSSCFDISEAVIEPFRSCLFAYINTPALDNSSLASITYNSSLITESLSLSVESITTITN